MIYVNKNSSRRYVCMKIVLSAVILSVITLINAEAPLIEKIFLLPENSGGEIVYFNDFTVSSQIPDFRRTDQFSLDPSGGENGTAAIKCEKSDPSKLQELTIWGPVLQGGKTYQTETVIRAEDIQFAGTGIASSSIELFKNNKRASGGVYSVYRKKDYVPGKWFVLKAKFGVAEDGVIPRYSIYMMRNTAGRFYISSLCIKTAGRNADILLVHPNHMTLDPSGSAAVFKVSGVPENARLAVSIQNAGKVHHLSACSKNGFFRLEIPPLKPGKAEVEVRAADHRATELYCKNVYRFTVRKLDPSRFSVMPDHFQRLMISGKPFMPIGIFGYKTSGSADLKKISDAGFNCYLDYDSKAWGKAGRNLAGYRKMLDRYAEYGLKCIFNIRWQSAYTGNAIRKTDYAGDADSVTAHIVKYLADHPALLAWYLSDETTRVNIPHVVHLRQIVSEADPYHPTLGVSCYPADLAAYGNTADIVAVDPYPIGDTGKAVRGVPQSLTGMLNLMDRVRGNGQIMWIVPQAFSWGGYRTRSAEGFNRWRHPTADEIRAMPLLAVLHGAKGFIFYSYSPQGCQYSAEYEKIRWDAIRDSVKDLKVLEKFIMSRQKIQLLANTADHHCGMLTADDGKRAVVLVGIKEHSAGKVNLPPGSWQIISGNAEIQENNLVFDFSKICSVILTEK